MFTRLKKAFIYHYSNTNYQRTDEQLEREKWLIPRIIPFNRYMLMPCAVLAQACTGSLYAWSGFNLPIEAALYGRNGGVDRAQAVNVFYVAVAGLGISAALLGPWLERNGPLKGLLLGSFLFYFGNLITALGVYVKQIAVIHVGYGVIGGIGLGISYISPVSPLQKWFPEIRGVAAGLAICGFGAGSIFSPFTQKALIGPNFHKTGEANVGIELTFVILGSCYFVIMTLCALVLRMPPPGYIVHGITIDTVKGAERKTPRSTEGAPNRSWLRRVFSQQRSTTTTVSSVPKAHSNGSLTANDETKENGSVVLPVVPDIDYSAYFSMTLGEALSSIQYWMIYITFLGAQISGLLIISKIQSIIQNQLAKSADDAASVNSILGGVNVLGRLVLPPCSDLIRARKPLFVLSLVCQAICLICLPAALDAKSYGGVLTCAFVIGFFYGGGFGMIPAFLADQFGSKNVGATHGVILTTWAINAVVGGLIFSAVYNSEKARHHDDPLIWYDLNFRWMLAPVLTSLLVSLFIPTHLRDRKLPRVPGEVLRFRFIDGRLVRWVGWRPLLLSKEEEKLEWKVYLSSLPHQPTTDRESVEIRPDVGKDSASFMTTEPRRRSRPSVLHKTETTESLM